MIVVDSDFSALEGTNCYCSDESAAQIRQAISGLPLCAVHRIGTGDYHYISLFWLERVTEPFTLILFDNHPDDQPTAFSPDTISCGSWVAEARKLPLCQDVIWIRSFSYLREARPTNLRFAHPTTGCAGGPPVHVATGGHGFPDAPPGEPRNLTSNVYVSIDLDVLSEEYARTDWDQGTMTLDELVATIQHLKKSARIVGVDICGGLTPQKGATDRDLAINARTESALVSLFCD